jgi:hypothetical protein
MFSRIKQLNNTRSNKFPRTVNYSAQNAYSSWAGRPLTATQLAATSATPTLATHQRRWTTPIHPDQNAAKVILGETQSEKYTGTFTLLNPNHFEINRHTLAEQYRAIHIQRPWLPRVALPRVHRSTLHEVIVSAVLTCQYENGDLFRQHAADLYKQSYAVVASQFQAFKDLDKKADHQAQSALLDVLKEYKAFEASNNDDLPLHKHIFTTLTAIKNNMKNGDYTPAMDTNIPSLVAEITSNDLKREYRQTRIRDIVSRVLSDDIASRKLPTLERVRPEDGLTIMLIGGSATGKSSLSKDILWHYQQTHGIAPQNFSLITSDRNRKILFNDKLLGDDNAQYGTLTQEEAGHITSLQLHRRKEMIDNGFTVHTFLEQIFILPNDVNLITYGNTKLRMYSTSCDADTAIENDYTRYLRDRERLTPRSAIIQGQKTVSAKLPVFLKDHHGKDIIIEIHNTQKRTINKDNKLLPIAIMNLKEKRIYLHDINAFLDFIKKDELNISAHSAQTLFSNPEKITPLVNAAKLKSLYSDYEILFINPLATDIDYHNHDTHIYARHTATQGLTIENETIFNQVNGTEAGHAVFSVLSSNSIKPQLSANMKPK